MHVRSTVGLVLGLEVGGVDEVGAAEVCLEVRLEIDGVVTLRGVELMEWGQQRADWKWDWK